MALMKFREKNKARWLGVRPAHYGEQVTKNGSVVNNTVIVHTVTAGKTFYLSSAVIGLFSTGTASGYLLVRDDGDVLQYNIVFGRIINADEQLFSMGFDPPIEIPEGWDICVSSNSADMYVEGFIHGWEETD